MNALLTPAQVAALLAVSRRTVQRMAEAGELPGLRVGSQWRFSPDRLAEWQAARTTGNPTRERQASAPAAATVARPEPLPVGGLSSDYVPVFGGLTATGAVSSAARRSGSATRNRKPA